MQNALVQGAREFGGWDFSKATFRACLGRFRTAPSSADVIGDKPKALILNSLAYDTSLSLVHLPRVPFVSRLYSNVQRTGGQFLPLVCSGGAERSGAGGSGEPWGWTPDHKL